MININKQKQQYILTSNLYVYLANIVLVDTKEI